MAKMNANIFITKDYENGTAFRPQKNKPNQTQFQNTTPKEREEQKGLWEAAEKAILFFYVAKQANSALYSENTDT
jgi:hypothetical protein